MTYTETQLEAIKIFGRKDLTEGCVFTVKGEIYELRYVYGSMYYTDSTGKKEGFLLYKTEHEILGHIPHLFPDVARVAEKKNIFIEIQKSRYSKTGYILNFCKGIDTPMLSLEFVPSLPLLDHPSLPQIISLFK